MERLWAPWRLKFVTARGRKHPCVFCSKPRSRNDRKNYILRRSPLTYVMLNLYPYTSGHCLLSSYRHCADLTELGEAEWLELARETRSLVGRLRRALKPDGFNIGANLGGFAGGSVPDHFHIHVVPRWKGDTNFMPVLTGSKVISESLDAMYRQLHDGK